jgi:hypothetical protein
MQKIACFVLFTLFFSISLSGQLGCPGCMIALPSLPKDTIYLGNAPSGNAGSFYEGSISFRLPKTTTPVNAIDPSTPGGLPINKITIQSVANLPPGLRWVASQTTFNPSNITDGCVTLCGSPLIPGYYDVEVFVTAEVLLINQSTSFTFPIYIGPSVSENQGFSMVNSSGCGSTTVAFKNNLQSNGKNGYSYFWDFGNGTTSILENPGSITYSRPGTYVVNYQASVDTAGYFLTEVKILEAGCKDLNLPPIFNKAPDLYVKLRDPLGNVIYQTTPVKNTPIPYAFSLYLPLGIGNYSLEVRDNETIGTKNCGTINFSRATGGLLGSGDLKIELRISHPITTIQEKDTVFVYEVPEKPKISPSGRLNLCAGQEIALETNYSNNIQWFKDSSLIFGATSRKMTFKQSGNYHVEIASLQGCKASSEIVNLRFEPLPNRPIFLDDNNKLVIRDLALLPKQYRLQWYLDEKAILGATDTVYCNTLQGTNLYGLQVTDLSTNCINTFSLGVSYNKDFNCGKLLEEIILEKASILIYPNPTAGISTLEIKSEGVLNFNIKLYDPVGRLIFLENQLDSRKLLKKEINLSGLPNGLYFLVLESKGDKIIRHILKSQ